MFRITPKMRIAAGLAAGALTLGAAAVYAAANANNTMTVRPTPIALGSGSNHLNPIGFNGTTSTTLPAGGFKTAGDCVSFLAKSYHGKLMSGANAWCKLQLTATAMETGSTASLSGAPHGNGRANGHSTRAKPTN